MYWNSKENRLYFSDIFLYLFLFIYNEGKIKFLRQIYWFYLEVKLHYVIPLCTSSSLDWLWDGDSYPVNKVVMFDNRSINATRHNTMQFDETKWSTVWKVWNTDQKRLRIWTLFTQWRLIEHFWKTFNKTVVTLFSFYRV